MNELGTADEMVALRVMGSIMGLVNAVPAYRINVLALAKCLHMRADRMELKTSPGRAKHNSTAIPGAADVNGIAWGVRVDGTEDLIVGMDGGYWRIVGNTKTLISKVHVDDHPRLVSALGTVVYVSATAKMTRANVGDYFFRDEDGPVSAVAIDAVGGNDTTLVLVSAYGTTAVGTSAFTIWDKQAVVKSRIRMFMNRWHFVNGTNAPMEWDGNTSVFREVGLPSAAGLSALTSAGGNMNPGTYTYKVCWRDARACVGMPSAPFAVAINASGTAVISFPTVRAEVTRHEIYRTSANGTTFHFLTSGVDVSAVSWHDDSADSALNTLINPPVENFQPPVGAEDFEIHKDRVVWFKGPRAYVGGLDPLDPHAGVFQGRYQPWYAPSRQWWLGRDKGEQPQIMGSFSLGGRLHALRSRSLWVLYDRSDNPNVWEWIEILPDVGCESRWTVGHDGEVAYWLGRKDGRLTVVKYNGFEEFVGRDVQGTLDTIISASEAAGGCSNGYYRLAFSGSDGNTELEWQTDKGDGRGVWATRDWRHLCYVDAEGVPYAGGSAGFVYQLDTGRDDDGAPITRDLEFPALSVPVREGQAWEYPAHWRVLQLEIESLSSVGAMSGYLKMDNGSYLFLSGAGFPISCAGASAWIHRTDLPNEFYGRRAQLRLKSAGTGEAYTVRGHVLKAELDKRESI